MTTLSKTNPGSSGRSFFAPTAGAKTAALHIVSNDSDENPFEINLMGLGLSSTTATDGDGLNDAAEFQMAVLAAECQSQLRNFRQVHPGDLSGSGLAMPSESR